LAVISHAVGPAGPACRDGARPAPGGDRQGSQAPADTRPSAPEAVVRVPVRDLLPGESPRSKGLDQDHVRVLASVEGPLPPISVHRETMRVIDGAHRLAAARLAGRTEIDVVFYRGGADEAFRLGVAANIAHGLPLSLADRRAAALRIIRSHPQLSDRAIARSTGLSHKTVAALRAAGPSEQQDGSGQVRVGVDGRVRPLDASAGRLAAGRIIAERPDATLREIAGAAGISLGTAKDVRARMLVGQSPLPAGRAAPASKRPVTAPVDVEDALSFLRRDPALRYSDSGRAFLQWLAARRITVELWQETLADLPPHLNAAIASVAREYARAWAEIADELEEI
jgi:ParB-like chromosome segregation protein Spo0J